VHYTSSQDWCVLESKTSIAQLHWALLTPRVFFEVQCLMKLTLVAA